MATYEVIVEVAVPDVEAESIDDAINYVTEQIEDAFDRPVTFDRQRTINYHEEE